MVSIKAFFTDRDTMTFIKSSCSSTYVFYQLIVCLYAQFRALHRSFNDSSHHQTWLVIKYLFVLFHSVLGTWDTFLFYFSLKNSLLFSSTVTLINDRWITREKCGIVMKFFFLPETRRIIQWFSLIFQKAVRRFITLLISWKIARIHVVVLCVKKLMRSQQYHRFLLSSTSVN